MSWDDATAASKIGDLLAIIRGDPIPGTSPTTPSKTDPLQSVHRSYTGGYTGSGPASSDQDPFYQAVLQGLGYQASDANMAFMRAWNQAEGMSSSHYNPFATTQYAPGGTAINSVGVQSYPDFQTGVNATIQTLQNGNYAGILGALQQGTDPMAAAQAVANSPWGTGSLVMQVLGG